MARCEQRWKRLPRVAYVGRVGASLALHRAHSLLLALSTRHIAPCHTEDLEESSLAEGGFGTISSRLKDLEESGHSPEDARRIVAEERRAGTSTQPQRKGLSVERNGPPWVKRTYRLAVCGALLGKALPRGISVLHYA